MLLQTDLNLINNFLGNPTIYLIFILLSIWTLIWKGIALWRASRNNQRNWFIALLVINTFGILEIIYIFYFSKAKSHEKPENLTL
ncbi:MAG: DUF5652 family protein [Patescibacteria group bacterium]